MLKYNKLKWNNVSSRKKQQELINAGQQKMKETIEADSSIMNVTQERTKELIANHIDRIGKMSRKEYEIKREIR